MSYRRNEENERDFSLCATCDAVVFPEVGTTDCADADTVCALCGMKIAELPSGGGDYFDVIMRVGHPGRPGVRPRHPRY